MAASSPSWRRRLQAVVARPTSGRLLLVQAVFTDAAATSRYLVVPRLLLRECVEWESAGITIKSRRPFAPASAAGPPLVARRVRELHRAVQAS